VLDAPPRAVEEQPKSHGHAKEDDHASNDTPERSFAEVLAQVATQRGTPENVKDDTARAKASRCPRLLCSVATACTRRLRSRARALARPA
jgi:hypothetical protein